ncbi:ATP-binding protein [Streptomyces sp. T-3]|nr:ATP-binding protein [Streptomyces sp. T-3]
MLTTTPDPPARASSTRAPTTPAPPRRRRFVQWLPPAAASVPRTRARVGAVLAGWRVPPDTADTLLLAVSELVTNAVLHAGAVTERLRITVILGDGRLQLEVADGDPALPPLDREAERDMESGRGLTIVRLLATEASGDVTALPHGAGKVIRVRIPAS